MKPNALLEAKSRDGSGKGAARALRREGVIPAIIYGNEETPAKIILPLKELTLEYKKGSFFNKIIDINVDGKVLQALPRDVQTHPVTDVIEHADFQRVDKDSIIHVMVPVKVLNQEKSIGLKRGGVLNIVRHEIELLCKPGSIPSAIEVDVLQADIGHSIHINDIQLPPDVKTAIKDRNFTVITVAGRSKDEEERPNAATAAAATDAAAPAAKAGDAKAAPAAAAKPAADAKKK
jgi:large subunit ribosomal protein L25